MKTRILISLLIVGGLLAHADQSNFEFYSRAADEYRVQFSAELKTEYLSLDQIRNLTPYQKVDMQQYLLNPTLKFIFGPLTHRSLGGEQKGFQVNLRWNEAYLQNNQVIVPYDYSGQWLLSKKYKNQKNLQLPVPYSHKLLRTSNWKNCSNADPQHQDLSAFWYYWDPAKSGCDHQIGVHYQLVNPTLSEKTQQTQQSFPEYQKMIVENKLKMTFAFGYVEEPSNPDPFKDSDSGVYEFRRFINMVKNEIADLKSSESPIYESEYLGSEVPNKKIGVMFRFNRRGIDYEVKIVASADIDQMELFAKSFAKDHDAYFGWFGHSRVGNGFDASRFNSMMASNRSYYSLTSNYQLIYWAGCNSYSYYTQPFFEFKANLIKGDLKGTKSLDIISNGLPSYFSLNAMNAKILFDAMLYLEKKSSYQEIVGNLEQQSNAMGAIVLVNVLGDDDNDSVFD